VGTDIVDSLDTLLVFLVAYFIMDCFT